MSFVLVAFVSQLAIVCWRVCRDDNQGCVIIFEGFGAVGFGWIFLYLLRLWIATVK